jgi:hypothetical protein
VAENIRLAAIKSFYSNRLGLVVLEDDVLSVVSQVRELSDGRITVELDPENGYYHLVEHCEDSTDRLVFTVKELDGRVIQRLQKADQQSRLHEDPYDATEREQDEEWKRQEDEGREKIREAGEELLFNLRRAGVTPRMPFPVAIPKDVHADK